MKLLLYCTKAKPYLRDYRGKAIFNRFVISPTNRPFTSDDTQPILNGKIVAECDFEVKWESTDWYCNDFIEYKGLEKSCLTKEQLFDYVKGRDEFYAIHIKNLKIFDEPRELDYYYRYCPYSYNPLQPIKVAPQNMMYAYNFKDYDEKPEYIIISIKPQWLCKILNNEKTIEVRKKVLREMIK